MTNFESIDSTVVIICLLFTIAYLATVAYWERGDYDRIKANLQRLHHAHLDLVVRHNTQTGRLMDVQRDLRNAEARLAQAAGSQAEDQPRPPVVCISVYKHSHLFSDN